MIDDKRSWFWPVQITCWALVGFLNWLVQYTSGSFSNVNLYLNLAGVCVGGFVVTSLYRIYFKRRKLRLQINAAKLIAYLFASAFVQAVVWIFILSMMMLVVMGHKPQTLASVLFQIVPLTGVMLAWDSVYLGYYLIRRYHSTEVEKWQLEAEVRQAQLGTLRAQINPHFLFNALNNIRALILEDPNLARQTLTRFSEIFRHALQHTNGKEINLAEEVNILTQYLELVKIQYEEKLNYNIQVDGACLGDVIPPMVLQLLVENAIKHGIALQTNGGYILIDIGRNGNELVISVANTGTLSIKNELEDNLGIGLQNIKERLRLLYGANASLSINEEPPYVKVTVTIKK